MDQHEQRYAESHLVREMLETPAVIRNFDVDRARDFAPMKERILLTGEGSSRILPAGLARLVSIRRRADSIPVVEGATQAMEYPLSRYNVYAASNSGRTAEIVSLLRRLRHDNVDVHTTAVVANGDSPIADLADRTFVLSCGDERATAATKSVVEQALFYQVALDGGGRESAGSAERAPWSLAAHLPKLADNLARVLEMDVPAEIVSALVSGSSLYFAGANDGVAEELALKANEIARRPSDFLSGTYAVHGIEEVMRSEDIVVWVEPPEEWEDTFEKTLVEGVGLTIIAISTRDTRFPTIRIPDVEREEAAFLSLAAGWNLLVELGLALGVDIDSPERARKVGNEYTQSE